MGKVGAEQDQITVIERFHIIPYQPHATSPSNQCQLRLRMEMPMVIQIWTDVLPNAERIVVPGIDFPEDRFHQCFIVRINIEKRTIVAKSIVSR
jgi:hypothetical protein